MPVLVVIPTTAGPLILRKLTARSALPASCAFADGDYRPLPWSNDYARLVGPQGPLARQMPAVGQSAYELRLSGSFDAGRSWETPVALAHMLIAAGETLTDDPAKADRIVWATGALDLDLGVIPGDYALITKLEKSKALFDAAPHAVIDIRLPHGQEGEAARVAVLAMLPGRKAEVSFMTALVEKAEALPPDQSKAHRRVTEERRLAIPAAALALATVLAGGVWFYVNHSPPAAPQAVGVIAAPPVFSQPKPAEATLKPPQPLLSLVVEELRAPANGSCRALLFGSGQPVVSVIVQTEGRLNATTLDRGLCGLRYKVNDPARERFILPPELLAVTIMADPAEPAGVRTVFLRENIRQNVVYAVQWSREGDGGRQVLPVSHELKVNGP